MTGPGPHYCAGCTAFVDRLTQVQTSRWRCDACSIRESRVDVSARPHPMTCDHGIPTDARCRHCEWRHLTAPLAPPSLADMPRDTLDVVAGLLLREGRALLGLRHDHTPERPVLRSNLWEMPGGKTEGAEGHHAALAREWREELNLEVRVGDLIALAYYVPEVPTAITLYEVHAIDPTAEPSCLAHKELRWVDPLEAIKHLPCSPAMFLHGPVLRQWLAKRGAA